jgi:methylenetetrahydrofolate reductase (NADPH)
MTQHTQARPVFDPDAHRQTIEQLAREASIEISVEDVVDLHDSRAFLPEGKRIYISHLPKQTWQETLAAAKQISHAGFDAIPHVPVRLLESEAELDRFLEEAVRRAGIREVLVVAGDYPQPAGPYATVADVLRSGRLNAYGIRRVSLAGHPEGHPKVALADLRRAEAEKSALAMAAGLETTLVTQFFFEATPFLAWAANSRAEGIRARLVGGLAGPASIATLLKYAVRCGVGPSIRALGARPGSVMKLLADHGPEHVIRELAASRSAGVSDFDGVHLFSFGGYLHTCKWLHRVAQGRFELDAGASFKVF